MGFCHDYAGIDGGVGSSVPVPVPVPVRMVVKSAPCFSLPARWTVRHMTTCMQHITRREQIGVVGQALASHALFRFPRSETGGPSCGSRDVSPQDAWTERHVSPVPVFSASSPVSAACPGFPPSIPMYWTRIRRSAMAPLIPSIPSPSCRPRRILFVLRHNAPTPLDLRKRPRLAYAPPIASTSYAWGMRSRYHITSRVSSKLVYLVRNKPISVRCTCAQASPRCMYVLRPDFRCGFEQEEAAMSW